MRKLTGSRVANAIIIVALATVPLLYSSLLTWAYEAPIPRINRIPAAIVNLDQPASATANGKTQHFDVGEELTDKLTGSNTEDQGFKWQRVDDEQEARDGLESGTYQAVLLIPEGVSENLAGLANPGNGNQPKDSTLHLYTNDGVNYLTGTTATSVSRTLQTVLSEQAADKYINTLLLQMGPLKDGMTQASDGAGKLADGNNKLATGATKLYNGTTTLKGGTSQLATGSTTLTAGIDQILAGSQQLQSGSHTLSQGIASYTTGVDQVAAGTDQLYRGLTQGQNLSLIHI